MRSSADRPWPVGMYCATVWLVLHAFNATGIEAAAQHARDSDRRPFELLDQNGQLRSDKDFYGSWLVVYFGFTNCPDVCPLSVSQLAQAMRLLGADAARVHAAFITVDPERDTPAVLSRYLAKFEAPLIGLTGTKAQITSVMATFDAYAATQAAREDGSYMIEHSSSFYIIDPNGRLRRRLSAETRAPVLADTLRLLARTG